MPFAARPGETIQATIYLQNGNIGPSADACTYSATQGGIGTTVRAHMQGSVVDKASQCVPAEIIGKGKEQVTLGFAMPESPGEYEINFVARGNVTGNKFDSLLRAVKVEKPTKDPPDEPPDTPDPSYTATIQSAPSEVKAGEKFQINATATCNNGPCPEANYSLSVAGIQLDSGTVQLADGEQFTLTVGPDDVFINQPGEHVVTWQVRNASDTARVSVQGSETPDPKDYPDPPKNPPDDPKSGSSNLALAALAGVAAAIVTEETERKDKKKKGKP